MNTILKRISENEEKLDNINLCIKQLEDTLTKFKLNKNNINLINKYYGSKDWFNDKKLYENNKIKKIKAGVLSEDSVWNTLKKIDDLMLEMKLIIEEYYQDKR